MNIYIIWLFPLWITLLHGNKTKPISITIRLSSKIQKNICTTKIMKFIIFDRHLNKAKPWIFKVSFKTLWGQAGMPKKSSEGMNYSLLKN